VNTAGPIAYDSGKGEIFVTNADFGSVSVISDSTNTVIANITSEIQPLGLAYDSGKGEIFVANSEHNMVSVISDSSGTSASPSPTAPEFSTACLILVVVAVVVAGLLVYFKKRKRQADVYSFRFLN
jgi:YVTN family beta-propeller protein